MVRYCYLWVVSWFTPTMPLEALNSRAFASEDQADEFAAELAMGYWSISRVRVAAEATRMKATHRVRGQVIAQSEGWEGWVAGTDDRMMSVELEAMALDGDA